MKPTTLLLPLFAAMTLFSCTKKDPSQPQLVGNWDDVIQLSQKDFTFKATGDSALITAKGKWMGLSCVSLDTNRIIVYGTSTNPCNLTYTDSNLTISTKNCDTLFIKLNKNNADSARVLQIGVWAGDYHDGIKITQAKNSQ